MEDATLIWKIVGDKATPVQVRRGPGDGTRSVVTPLEEGALKEGDAIATGVTQAPRASGDPRAAEGNNLFGMKRPERRQRSAGGVEARPGQNNKGGDRPGPPM